MKIILVFIVIIFLIAIYYALHYIEKNMSDEEKKQIIRYLDMEDPYL